MRPGCGVNRFRYIRCILLLPLFCCVSTLRAQDIHPEDVSRAIEQGVRYLKSKQQREGNWVEGSHAVGMTALCTIAMLSAGVSRDDPAIVNAMQYLRRFRVGPDFNQNYSIALQTMAFALCDPERDRPLIRENVRQIEEHQTFEGPNSPANGGWTYIYTGRKAGQRGSDNSNAQFSILALYEAERVGVSAKQETWARARNYWENCQNANGAWGYTPTSDGSTGIRASMTCAGIASLMISSGMTSQDGAAVRGDQILCGLPAQNPSQERIRRGLDWMERNFSVEENKGHGGTYLLYYLYGLERVGRMSGQRFIGKHDWYREGTAFLLKRKGELNTHWSDNLGDLSGTSFALLFLSRGRRPVLLSKIEFGTPGDHSWNMHPNDVDHLTRFVESRWKIDLTWQVVPMEPASVEVLLQSPVLYLSGSKSPLPNDPDRAAAWAAKLRGYLDGGGFIFAEAQPNDVSFDKGFRELMRQVLPEEGYELRLLGAEHPIWQAEVTIEPDRMRPIEGIEYGCRTGVVYCRPVKKETGTGNRPSLSCLWEVARPVERDDPYPEAVQRQIEAGLGIGINVLTYATNREMKTKDRKMLEAAAQVLSDVEQRRGQIYLGLLETGSGAGSAPRALPNMLQWAGVHLGIPVDVRADKVHFGTDAVFDFPIVFMHGRGAFTFTEEERTRVAEYVKRGGTLFVNAICSSKPFTDSFKEEMRTIFPEEEWTLSAVEPDDPLLSDVYGGFPIERLEVRVPQQSPNRKMRVVDKEVVPELLGIKVADRWGVVFSPLDVSCALEKTNSLDCKGYTRESAMKLGINTLLYSLGHM